MLEELLIQILSLEKENRLYDIRIEKFSVYRIFRFRLRNEFIKSVYSNFTNDTRSDSRKLYVIVLNILYSFIDIIKLLVYKYKADNVFFPHFRLYNVQGKLYEKFTDPFIAKSDVEFSSIIFQQSYRFNYRNNRIHKPILFQFEFVYVFSVLLSILLFPYFYLKYYSLISLLSNRIFTAFSINCDKSSMIFKLGKFKIISLFLKLIFKRLCVKRVFIVDKECFFPQIYAAHSLGIPVFEFQHGVTLGPTVLYYGDYDSFSDPDYFLTFGKVWSRSSYFSLPEYRILNIGFPFREYLKNYSITKRKDSVLIISSPEYTSEIVAFILNLADLNKNINFHFRCHPQEQLSKSDFSKISTRNNILISDKSIDSNIELQFYDYVIGVESTVLFEASSYGKYVGFLSSISRSGSILFNSFFSVKDPISFTEFYNSCQLFENEFFSDFNFKVLDKILNNV